MDLGFRCPVCGSQFFTTINMSTEPWTRQCRGRWMRGGGYSGCSYTWTSDRDARHGLQNFRELQK